jgi:hypothetical protein
MREASLTPFLLVFTFPIFFVYYLSILENLLRKVSWKKYADTYDKVDMTGILTVTFLRFILHPSVQIRKKFLIHGWQKE